MVINVKNIKAVTLSAILISYGWTIEEYSAIRGSSPQIMKIELVSISDKESSILHSEFHSDVIFRAWVRVTLGSLQAIASNDKQNPVLPFSRNEPNGTWPPYSTILFNYRITLFQLHFSKPILLIAIGVCKYRTCMYRFEKSSKLPNHQKKRFLEVGKPKQKQIVLPDLHRTVFSSEVVLFSLSEPFLCFWTIFLEHFSKVIKVSLIFWRPIFDWRFPNNCDAKEGNHHNT